MTNQCLYCTFRLDQMLFGVDVARVQEVIREQQMACVPRAPAVVRGLMNLRGQIVTALDLRRRLQLGEPTTIRPLMNVVIRTSDDPVSLLVDEVGEVVPIDPDQIEEPPKTLLGPPRELITGAYKLERDLLMILDIDATLELSI